MATPTMVQGKQLGPEELNKQIQILDILARQLQAHPEDATAQKAFLKTYQTLAMSMDGSAWLNRQMRTEQGIKMQEMARELEKKYGTSYECTVKLPRFDTVEVRMGSAIVTYPPEPQTDNQTRETNSPEEIKATLLNIRTTIEELQKTDPEAGAAAARVFNDIISQAVLSLQNLQSSGMDPASAEYARSVNEIYVRIQERLIELQDAAANSRPIAIAVAQARRELPKKIEVIERPAEAVPAPEIIKSLQALILGAQQGQAFASLSSSAPAQAEVDVEYAGAMGNANAQEKMAKQKVGDSTTNPSVVEAGDSAVGAQGDNTRAKLTQNRVEYEQGKKTWQKYKDDNREILAQQNVSNQNINGMARRNEVPQLEALTRRIEDDTRRIMEETRKTIEETKTESKGGSPPETMMAAYEKVQEDIKKFLDKYYAERAEQSAEGSERNAETDGIKKK